MSLPLMYATCFSLSIVSALLPWVNGEVLMLSYSAFAHSPLERIVLALLASSGQIVGKCVLYWAGRGAIPLGSGKIGRIVTSCKERFTRSSLRPMWLVFFSALSGIPPFYVITVLAGAFRLRFSHFIAVGACGRIIHFGILALVPQLFPSLSNLLDTVF
jgi:membrane protein YqaA with SNARE-associated domain